MQALIDRDGKRFRDLGLGSSYYSDERWLERLVDDPLLLRTPLVRSGKHLTIGYEPDTWASWQDAG